LQTLFSAQEIRVASRFLLRALLAFVALAAVAGGAWLYSTFRDAGGPDAFKALPAPSIGPMLPPSGVPQPEPKTAPPASQTPPKPEPAPQAQAEPERVDLATDMARFVIAHCRPAGAPGGGKQGAMTLRFSQLVARYAPETDPAALAASKAQPDLGVELSPTMLEIVYAIAASTLIEAVVASAEEAARSGPSAAKSDAFVPQRAAELLHLSADWLRGLSVCAEPTASGPDCRYARQWFDGLLAGQRDKERTVAKATSLLGHLSARLESRAATLTQAALR
jgi:hypothetical protein